MERIYAWVREAGGTDERDVQREPGVTYNPRPGRVCHILVRDAGVRDEHMLIAGMLGCLPAEKARDLPATLAEFQTVLNEILEALDGAPSRLPDAALVTQALVLDELRHLHMTMLATEERRNRFRGLDAVLASIADSHMHPRLAPLLAAARTRVETALGMNEARS